MAEVFEKAGDRSVSCTITFLEMATPPTRPVRPAPLRKLAILRANKPPLSFYLWLYRTVGEGGTGHFQWLRPKAQKTGTCSDSSSTL